MKNIVNFSNGLLAVVSLLFLSSFSNVSAQELDMGMRDGDDMMGRLGDDMDGMGSEEMGGMDGMANIFNMFPPEFWEEMGLDLNTLDLNSLFGGMDDGYFDDDEDEYCPVDRLGVFGMNATMCHPIEEPAIQDIFDRADEVGEGDHENHKDL